MVSDHQVTDDGELTANWFCQKGDFWGTINQLLLCARCGEREFKRHDQPRHFRGPHIHFICDSCWDELP